MSPFAALFRKSRESPDQETGPRRHERMAGILAACRTVPLPLAMTVLLAGCAAFPGRPSPPAWPGPDRAELEIPEPLWRELLDVARRPEGIGFTESQMRLFDAAGSRLIPRGLWPLFADVRAVPRASGLLADSLVGARGDPASVAWLAQILNGRRGGREWTRGRLSGQKKGQEGKSRVPSGSWGVAWLTAQDPDAALDAILSYGREVAPPVPEDQRRVWTGLPEGAKRLVVRLFVAAARAAPALRDTVDIPFLCAALGVPEAARIRAEDLYALATDPWTGKEPPRAAGFALMERVDLTAQASAAVRYLADLEGAVEEYRAWVGQREKEGALPAFPEGPPLVLETSLGTVRICLAGADRIPGGDLLVVDLGGDDSYAGRTGASGSLDVPVAAVVDLAGNDRYAADQPASIACGLFGVGVVCDLAGDDAYRCPESGLGAAWYGTGLLWDAGGNDRYETAGSWGEGSGFFGAGILLDASGDDLYLCRDASQGFAGTGGTGLLLDLAGNDVYRSSGRTGPGNPFSDPVSFAQGASTGRRADFGDGRCLGGGFGVLVDGAGDDRYEAGVYAGGSGYWWGMGIFEDLSGNDTYARASYSLGAAPHFAIGVCVDRAGDDRYNVDGGHSRISLGHGRDGGVGVFIDGDGDDRYRMGMLCGGGISIQAVGLFWDRRGDDRYEAIFVPRIGCPYALGVAGGVGPDDRPRDSRDALPGTGAFLDTGGRDVYTALPAPDGASLPHGSLPAHLAADGGAWTDLPAGNLSGCGFDREWYPPPGGTPAR